MSCLHTTASAAEELQGAPVSVFEAGIFAFLFRCHSDRSGPAFSHVRFLHAGPRSGGISLRERQSPDWRPAAAAFGLKAPGFDLFPRRPRSQNRQNHPPQRPRKTTAPTTSSLNTNATTSASSPNPEVPFSLSFSAFSVSVFFPSTLSSRFPNF